MTWQKGTPYNPNVPRNYLIIWAEPAKELAEMIVDTEARQNAMLNIEHGAYLAGIHAITTPRVTRVIGESK